MKPRSQGYLLLTVIFGLLCQGFASPSAKIKEEKIMPTASCEENIASASSNLFAFDLYSELKKEQGNLFFSPYSVFTAMTMISGGAGSQTAEQLRHGLRLLTPDAHGSLANLQAELNLPGSNYQLSIVNGLWGQTGYVYKRSFIDLLKKTYHAEVAQVDFAKDKISACRTINNWIE
ncbi:hypothetical protein COT42_03705 [Candidatus Saganbacteria bacterium CG08_land_8_20_14_0_20_45_16]|uniref:Serpin domain-containing protein n=1 Tax=Candidatus Saganbacteria bacterium CG08_land_8_20_14_0_20_45_16 TaxID=2014293 RepID=A0A2H0XYK7_UNCSA|nr:MAG: hypothetical protein COT42_03705 [Candidatus Saganbacteria bacterium CG08_land_8_20_14_0_20_45_16]